MAIFPSLPLLTDDAEFARNLDFWGAYHRVVAAGAGIAIALLLLGDQPWVHILLTGYFGIGLLLLLVLTRASPALISLARPAWLLADIALVGGLTYVWGPRLSPAPFLFVPVVVGWTLVPQPGLGLASLALSLLVVGANLAMEAPGSVPAMLGRATSGPTLFFALFGGALAAAHFVVAFTVRRMAGHQRDLSRLREDAAQRRREAELLSTMEEAQRLEALGRLAGGIAHDFNNSLTALIGFTELAGLEMDRRPQKAKEALLQIEIAAQNAANLTRQLLDFASRRPTHPTSVDLSLEVARCAELIRRLLSGSISLTLDLTPSPCVANLDPGGIERILLNLAVNARDAMPTGGELSISLQREDGPESKQLLLRIHDTGQGIEPSDLPRVFEPFFTTKAIGRGTGLGLSSVYGLVKRAGGDIQVKSKVGVGTTFQILLPRIDLVARPAPLSTPIRSMSGLKVLVVDDDDGVRTVTCSYLIKAGFPTLEARGGDEALTLFNSHQDDICLIVSDVRMPGMTGVELAQRLRETAPRVPILMVSAYAGPVVDVAGGLPVGVALLPKPYTFEALSESVRAALGT